MNVLIVDDDRFVIAALLKGIDWNSLGFEKTYQAYNMDDARSIITDQQIDLLLSDIDMPHGSGIDLLRWMRDHHNDTPCIFLTNYADFNYAQQAVDLHCFHYFLKPVDYDRLTGVIQEAIKETEDIQSNESHKYPAFWHHFHVNGDISDDPYPENTYIIPVYLRFYPWNLTSVYELKNRLPQNTLSTVKQLFESTVTLSSSEGCMIMDDMPGSDRIFIAIPTENHSVDSDFRMSLESFLTSVIRHLLCPANLYAATPEHISDLYSVVTREKEMMRNDLHSNGHMLFLEEFYAPKDTFPPADTDIINACLEENHFDDLLSYSHSYLTKLSSLNSLSARSIESFQVDIVQALYSYMSKNGILANRLYSGEPYHTLSQKSRESEEYMESYLRYIFHVAESNLKEGSAPKDVARIIRDFVDTHYMEDISRESLSEILYFDPDYASRLFKKQYDISFTNYVIRRRLEEAKKLLTETTMPISTIASKVGYDNYSYFTRLFKKEVGMTPINYRASSQ